MDSLTHTVLGACLGEAIAGKKLGKKAMLIGALANNLPDIDVVSTFWETPASALLAHRGITHSILFALVVSPLLAYGFRKWLKNYPVSFRRWLLLIGSGLFIHIIMDAFTSYGTGWFEPFSHYRVSFNTLFIIDPFFLLPLLVATISLLILKRVSPARQKWARAGLGLSVLYLAVTLANKIYVNTIVKNDLALQQVPHSDYMVTPTPLNNLLWYIVTKDTNDESYVGYYSVFDKSPRIDYETIHRQDSLLAPLKKDADVQTLMQFSKGYYSVSRDDSSIIFSDMRFGQLGGWYLKNTPFVYNFNITHMGNNVTNLQQGRFKSFQPNVMQELVKRIKGHESNRQE